jgi:2,5-diketo-D-gluconate reductase B
MQHVVAHGARIPKIGLGTFRLEGGVCRRMVAHALEVGYRHLDTARMYGNEREVGAALAASGVPRDEIWLTTKIWPDDFRSGDLRRAAEASARALGTVPDLLLLHWPNRRVPLQETMAALNRTRRDGLTRHIGISNFTTALIEEAWSLTEEPLVVNQVEYHPYIDQRAVVDAVRARGMALIAYSPIAQGKVFRDDLLRRIGERYGKNPGQVALRWLLQQEAVAAIPRSSRAANVEANLEVFDFDLTAEEMDHIGSLGSHSGRLVAPASVAPAWD